MGGAARALQELGRLDEAWDRITKAYTAANDGSDDETVADLAQRRANVAFMRDDVAAALEQADAALRIADSLRLGRVLVRALTTKANSLAELGRPSESTALLTHAIGRAEELDLADEMVRGYYNLADNMMAEGRFAEGYRLMERGLEVARRRGDRLGERRLLAQESIALVALGRWDDALANAAQLGEQFDVWSSQAVVSIPSVLVGRGEFDALRELLDGISPAKWPALEAAARISEASANRGAPGARELVPAAREAALGLIPRSTSEMPGVVAELLDCAFAADDLDTVRTLLDAISSLKPAQLLPLLDAEATRARARLAAYTGDLADRRPAVSPSHRPLPGARDPVLPGAGPAGIRRAAGRRRSRRERPHRRGHGHV